MSIEFIIFISMIALAGLSKGGLGGSFAVLCVPILSLVMSPIEAVALMAPILVVMDLTGLYKFRKNIYWKELKIILPAGILGVGAGAFMFSAINENQLRIIIGIMGLVYLSREFYKYIAKKSGHLMAQKFGYIYGFLSGVSSVLAHAGSPPLSVYILSRGMNKTQYHVTTIVFYTVINGFKILPYLYLGLLNVNEGLWTLYATPVAVSSMLMGAYLHHKIEGKIFFYTIYVGVFVASVKVLFDGLGFHFF